ncbi:MAG TPA: response regulator transcription factor [Opitutaceae bacterium]|nr:response regulator transcription factor [Opitutaceae bacterium]
MSSAEPKLAEKIAVLVVEDQTAIREMLVAFVAAMPGFAVVGEAGNVDEALLVAAASRPRVVVLDWMLLGGLGLEFLRHVRIDPPPYVLVFSANTTDLAVRESLAAGARGYLEKTASFSEFKSALQAVAEGRTYLGPAIAKNMRRLVNDPEWGASSPELSPRERDVLRFVAEGLSSKEIADRLTLSVRTVENHRASISRRTGLRSVAQLTLHAVRLGLIEAPAVENCSTKAEA